MNHLIDAVRPWQILVPMWHAGCSCQPDNLRDVAWDGHPSCIPEILFTLLHDVRAASFQSLLFRRPNFGLIIAPMCHVNMQTMPSIDFTLVLLITDRTPVTHVRTPLISLMSRVDDEQPQITPGSNLFFGYRCDKVLIAHYDLGGHRISYLPTNQLYDKSLVFQIVLRATGET